MSLGLIVDIILLAILALALISGMQKGFIGSCLSVLGFIASWFGAGAIYMNLTRELMSNQTLMNALASNLSTTDLISKAQGYTDGLLVSQANNSGIMANVIECLRENVSNSAFIDAFKKHAQNSVFSNFTLPEYLNQTIWQSVFNVISFLIIFIVLYVIVLLIVNLLNHVFRFPAIRGCDTLLGGVFGLVRGYIIACLVMALVPMIFNLFDATLFETITADSKVASLFMGDGKISDLFHVKDWVYNLITSIPTSL